MDLKINLSNLTLADKQIIVNSNREKLINWRRGSNSSKHEEWNQRNVGLPINRKLMCREGKLSILKYDV